MTSSSDIRDYFFLSIKHFPRIINGRINVVEFVTASTDLVAVIDRLGTVFSPVRLDVQGNIDKIKKFYKYDENSCLLELMLKEKAEGKVCGAVGVLWLNRGLLFFELIFMEIANNLRAQVDENNVNMKKIITTAYEGSVKVHHNWVTQQLFHFICKLAPTLPQVMNAVEVGNAIAFLAKLDTFNENLHSVRCKIDDFFRDNDIIDT